MIKLMLPLLFAVLAAPHAFAGDGCGSCDETSETKTAKVAVAEKQSGCSYSESIALKVAQANEKTDCAAPVKIASKDCGAGECSGKLVGRVAMADTSPEARVEACDMTSCETCPGCEMKTTTEVKTAAAEEKSCGLSKLEETKLALAETMVAVEKTEDVESKSCCPLPLLQKTEVARAD